MARSGLPASNTSPLSRQTYSGRDSRGSVPAQQYYDSLNPDYLLSGGLGGNLEEGEQSPSYGSLHGVATAAQSSPTSHDLAYSLNTSSSNSYRDQTDHPDFSHFPMQFDPISQHPYTAENLAPGLQTPVEPLSISTSIASPSGITPQSPYASLLTQTADFGFSDPDDSRPASGELGPSGMTRISGSPEDNSSETLADYYKVYQTRLQAACMKYRIDELAEAITQLLEVTEWLLTHVEDLGLTRDEEHLIIQRRQLWDDLNNCWLVVLQRQKVRTRALVKEDPDAPFPPSLISETMLKHAGDRLVLLADGVELFGLVDYALGIREEEIIDVLIDCRNVYKKRRLVRSSRSPSAPASEGTTTADSVTSQDTARQESWSPVNRR